MRKKDKENLTARQALKGLKLKLWTVIPMFVVVLALTIVGVWASQTVTIGVEGTISFQATNVVATIEGSVSGAKNQTTFSNLIYSPTNTPSTAQLATWKNKSFEFQNTEGANYGRDIVMTITITNNSSENKLNVRIVDSSTSSTPNLTKTIGGAGASFSINPNASSTATITFSVTDKNKSISSSTFNYKIILSDESFTG